MPAGARLGVQVAPVTDEIAGQLRLPNEVRGLAVASVLPTGPSAGLLTQGDVLTAALGPGAQRPLRTMADLQQALTSPPNGVVSLLVYSPQAKQTRVVNVPLRR
jgi:hypothetical protein